MANLKERGTRPAIEPFLDGEAEAIMQRQSRRGYLTDDELIAIIHGSDRTQRKECAAVNEIDGLKENIELDADGRHWIAVVNGIRIGGFKTEAEARRFLDTGTAAALVPAQNSDIG